MEREGEGEARRPRRFFVKVFAASRQAVVDLQEFQLDLFQSTGRATDDDRFSIDGLLSLREIERLVDAGYSVLVEEHESKRMRAVEQVSDFRTWIREMEA